MLIAGVDEAGRGCVIGPLVIAGVSIKTENIQQIIELGVKDSKLLTPKKREALYSEIIKIVQSYYTIHVLPCVIDKAVFTKKKLYKLNRLEAQIMAKIIEQLKPDEAYVDAADVIQERFGEHIQECLTVKTAIISKHKADRTFPIVSAASIIAKVERDRAVEELRVEYGDFGSGYLTDDKTTIFLKRLLVENNGDYPSCVRKSWKPARRAKAEHGIRQQTLI